jgi:hypothetical protein
MQNGSDGAIAQPYSLLTTHYSLLTTHYSLLTTHYSLLTQHVRECSCVPTVTSVLNVYIPVEYLNQPHLCHTLPQATHPAPITKM